MTKIEFVRTARDKYAACIKPSSAGTLLMTFDKTSDVRFYAYEEDVKPILIDSDCTRRKNLSFQIGLSHNLYIETDQMPTEVYYGGDFEVIEVEEWEGAVSDKVRLVYLCYNNDTDEPCIVLGDLFKLGDVFVLNESDLPEEILSELYILDTITFALTKSQYESIGSCRMYMLGMEIPVPKEEAYVNLPYNGVAIEGYDYLLAADIRLVSEGYKFTFTLNGKEYKLDSTNVIFNV